VTSRVVIVGGGITGLAAAHYLRRADPDAGRLSIKVLERRGHLGGCIRTTRRDGFLLEAGADSFLTTTPWAVRLAADLGLGGRLQGLGPRGRRAYILHRGRLAPLPEGLVLIAPPRVASFLRSPLLSPAGKIRAALDLVLPARRCQGDESLASFVRRRLGREVLERIADPMVAGIHAADPERLSVDAVLPQFRAYEREHGSVIRGLRAAPPPARSDLAEVPRPFATFPNGLGELVDAFRAQTPQVEWRTNGRASRVERSRDDRFQVVLEDGAAVAADAVLLATPSNVSAKLVDGLDSSLARSLAAIPYASSATVTMAFAQDACRRLDGSGFLVPREEGLRLKACTWASSKFEGRAPKGNVLLRAFYGGAREEGDAALPDEALADLALRELGPILGIRGEPRFLQVDRWPQAHPQYEVGHGERVAAIETARARVPGLYLAGSAYRGVGIPDCIHEARATVQTIADELTHLQRADSEVVT